MNEFTTCSRDIHHHVSDDTLPHRAINRIKTAVQMDGTLVASRWKHILYIVACHSERGLSAKLGLLPDVSGVFILFLFNTD